MEFIFHIHIHGKTCREHPPANPTNETYREKGERVREGKEMNGVFEFTGQGLKCQRLGFGQRERAVENYETVK